MAAVDIRIRVGSAYPRLPRYRTFPRPPCTEHLSCAIDACLRDANNKFDTALRLLRYSSPLFPLAA